MKNTTNFGWGGLSGHSYEIVAKYNTLLELLGPVEMLIQFERFVDDEDLSGLIMSVENNLKENGIELPYQTK